MRRSARPRGADLAGPTSLALALGAGCVLSPDGVGGGPQGGAGPASSGEVGPSASATSSASGPGSSGGGGGAAPSCSDGVANGDESDRDCGGSCGDCTFGLACASDEDCMGRCGAAGRCEPSRPRGTWTRLAGPFAAGAPGAPAERLHFRMAADPLQAGRGLLFGGLVYVWNPAAGYDSVTPGADTHVLDAGTWAEVVPAPATPQPAARYGHSMTAAPPIAPSPQPAVWLHGGAAPGVAPLADLHFWNGAAWMLAAADPQPAGLHGALAALPSPEPRLVLFGGLGLSPPGSTWLFSAGAWQMLPQGAGPPHRYFHAMIHDGQGVLLFGGICEQAPGQFGDCADTWRFDGQAWTQIEGSPAPPARHGHALVFDPGRGRVVLVGGASTTLFADTWEWDGARWSEVELEGAPPPAAHNGAFFDAARRRVVHHVSWSAVAFPRETWEYLPLAAGCEGPNQCPSGVCKSGLCCDRPCEGPGELCNSLESPGVCVTPAGDGQRSR